MHSETELLLQSLKTINAARKAFDKIKDWLPEDHYFWKWETEWVSFVQEYNRLQDMNPISSGGKLDA